jgi:coproporphyrinogen III oxidase
MSKIKYEEVINTIKGMDLYNYPNINENGMIIKYDIHHKLAYEKHNIKEYPIFINSIFNYQLIEHNNHINKNGIIIYDIQKDKDMLDIMEYMLETGIENEYYNMHSILKEYYSSKEWNIYCVYEGINDK